MRFNEHELWNNTLFSTAIKDSISELIRYNNYQEPTSNFTISVNGDFSRELYVTKNNYYESGSFITITNLNDLVNELVLSSRSIDENYQLSVFLLTPAIDLRLAGGTIRYEDEESNYEKLVKCGCELSSNAIANGMIVYDNVTYLSSRSYRLNKSLILTAEYFAMDGCNHTLLRYRLITNDRAINIENGKIEVKPERMECYKSYMEEYNKLLDQLLIIRDKYRADLMDEIRSIISHNNYAKRLLDIKIEILNNYLSGAIESIDQGESDNIDNYLSIINEYYKSIHQNEICYPNLIDKDQFESINSSLKSLLNFVEVDESSWYNKWVDLYNNIKSQINEYQSSEEFSELQDRLGFIVELYNQDVDLEITPVLDGVYDEEYYYFTDNDTELAEFYIKSDKLWIAGVWSKYSEDAKDDPRYFSLYENIPTSYEELDDTHKLMYLKYLVTNV